MIAPLALALAPGLAYLIGTWHCTTALGNEATHVVRRVDEQTIEMRNTVTWRGSEEQTLVIERYSPEEHGGIHVSSSAGTFRGDGPLWTDPTEAWAAAGYQGPPQRPQRVRVRYTPLDASAFERTWGRLMGDHETIYSTEWCTRLT